ncbi:uncharacterized protein LOC110030236 isoform X2 [Phalaenopsis equestris]|uniref:uncharacterized protein LOC110030236 isoform X2 n=1 Tax=Phalaenopsis equestris TaxID=78828 RepID=UPI0009E598E2|nr:uncharacterized protein LOC110030236 isoform X2 [Phalaenopsis equestris]
MGSCGDRHFFPLTSLQIGDMQSYLSTLTLFLPPESKNFLVLVDNRPWLIDKDKRTAYLWQLMVTKSRLSPFANTRSKRERKISVRKLDFPNNHRFIPMKLRRIHRWFTLIDAATYQKRVLLPVEKLKESICLNKELQHILYGFIVFEVAWNHVRGINYLNELQTDTCMALEVKLMKRWEFDSIEHALNCISSWHSGTNYERVILQDHLADVGNIGDVFYDAQEDISSFSIHNSNDVEIQDDKLSYYRFFDSSCLDNHDTTNYTYTPPAFGPYKKRKIMKVGDEVDEMTEAYDEVICCSSSALKPHSPNCDYVGLNIEPTTYKDGLILFKFNDHDLPFKLKDIIMPDLRLLTLLEYGLPSWVIFFQSYPVFCKIYRPWMCPLARALYVIISVVTVVIGFYDLYKNVPLLKATASGLFGPLFNWIESWEMISRLKYLGTMLFLHNFEKAIKWFLMATRAARSFVSILTRPIAAPLIELLELGIPIWNICLETIEGLGLVIWDLLESSYHVISALLQMILWPFWLLCSTISSFASLIICPMVWIFWEIFIAPVRLISGMVNFIVMISCNLYFLMRDTWSSMCTLFQFSTAIQATEVTSEASMWRSLWNDLFSQIFRALRSILYGFVAFFTTCNRHRLSIYNHIQELFLRFSNVTNSNLTRTRKKSSDENHATMPTPFPLTFAHESLRFLWLRFSSYY